MPGLGSTSSPSSAHKPTKLGNQIQQPSHSPTTSNGNNNNSNPSFILNLHNGHRDFLHHLLPCRLRSLGLQQVSEKRNKRISPPWNPRTDTEVARGSSDDDDGQNQLRNYGRSGYNKSVPPNKFMPPVRRASPGLTLRAEMPRTTKRTTKTQRGPTSLF